MYSLFLGSFAGARSREQKAPRTVHLNGRVCICPSRPAVVQRPFKSMTANIWRRLDSPLARKIVIFPSSFPLFSPLSSSPLSAARPSARRQRRLVEIIARDKGEKLCPGVSKCFSFTRDSPKIIDGLAVLVYHRHDFRPPLARIIRGATSFSTSEITASLKARATVSAIIYLCLTSKFGLSTAAWACHAAPSSSVSVCSRGCRKRFRDGTMEFSSSFDRAERRRFPPSRLVRATRSRVVPDRREKRVREQTSGPNRPTGTPRTRIVVTFLV